VTRPRAADDFPAIRARMEELRRECARADEDTRRPDGPPPYAISGRPGSTDRSSGLSPIMRRCFRGRGQHKERTIFRPAPSAQLST